MNLAAITPANADSRPRLADVCPAFRDKLRAFNAIALTDTAEAARLFAEAQAIGQAFWQGVDFACGADHD